MLNDLHSLRPRKSFSQDKTSNQIQVAITNPSGHIGLQQTHGETSNKFDMDNEFPTIPTE